MSFLLDTDTCSVHLKTGMLSHRLIQHAGRLHISVVTLAELFVWALRKKSPPHRLQGILDLLNDVVVLEVTPDVARRFGEVQAALRDAGQQLAPMDALIGATALVQGFTLVTHNRQHFSRIPGLALDDWLVP